MRNVASSRAKTVASLLADSCVPRLDAEVLLAHVVNKDRAWLLAHGEDAILSSSLSTFRSLLHRRQSGEPLAYIVGEKEFFGRSFNVDPRVMVPRPATEGLVEMTLELIGENPKSQIPNHKKIPDSKFQIVKKLDAGICGVAFLKPAFAFRSSHFAVVDVGTGSGCIAITLALELPDATIIASDISDDALDVAKVNAKRHGVFDRITFLHASGLPAYLPTNLRFLLVSNPPYLRECRDEDHSTACEPLEALFAGREGLDVLLPLVRQAMQHPRCIGFVVECLEDHVPVLRGALQ